ATNLHANNNHHQTTPPQQPPRSDSAHGCQRPIPQLVHSGKLDFLVFDYLSEITMSLLTSAKTKKPDLGYAPDFVQMAMAPFIKDIAQKGVRVVSNAGGVNPEACAEALRDVIRSAKVPLSVAVVTGDDLMSEASTSTLSHTYIDSGMSFPKEVHSMNAYLGAGGISRALDLGADVVITGRCVDSALVLGPLMHKFGWKETNYDLLAAGSLAGHLIECGAQCTGGIFTDWHTVADWDNIGFPVVECKQDGRFSVGKPSGTGGLVSAATVAEQLVYELGDPRKYLLPDVCCDFSQVTLTELPGSEGMEVLVSGAKGLPPPSSYKVSATYLDGYRATAVCVAGGSRATEKLRRTAESILKRIRRMFRQLGMSDFTNVNLQVLGVEDSYGDHAHYSMTQNDETKSYPKALEMFAREIAPAGTGMAPGLTAIVGGRPAITYLSKITSRFRSALSGSPHFPEEPKAELPLGSCSFRLEEMAYTRSGDKGNTANVGVIARNPGYYPYLKQHLTSQTVATYFKHLFEKGTIPEEAVSRYELPGIHGLNFVLHGALGGGGVSSLRSDPQGKALGQMLLDFKLENVPELSIMRRG
uniref:Si:ch73-132f6.5 n=1 Tax=Eptatretus burgeri TaxID=7764 RepID=A0A8C4QVM9_EPTBU